MVHSVYAPDGDGWEDAESDHYVERYLYDLAADPYERVNLAGKPEYGDVAERLRERLLARIEAVEGDEPSISPVPASDHP